jgi:L-threonylcarbamoyladenylate synthase
MITELIWIDCSAPSDSTLEYAGRLVREGKLVAFPTETVYGLGANALSAEAVSSIYKAKGRPSNNPLIVHIGTVDEAMQICSLWPEKARLLTDQFWPGPLTIVLPKSPVVPDNVTGGGETVAIRMPFHPVALGLIKHAGVPVAAPSANRSMSISPTTAQHVMRNLGGRIDLILDGGQTQVGLESTVLDLSQSPPCMLRPGRITPCEIEKIIGPISQSLPARKSKSEAYPSPGMLSRHYAPNAALECVQIGLLKRVFELTEKGHKVGVILWKSSDISLPSAVIRADMPSSPRGYASKLYAALHKLDEEGVEYILAEALPDGEEWMAAKDRLNRAAASKTN